MILLFHNLLFADPIANLILFLVVIVGWLCSVFLIYRGIVRFIKSEERQKLLVVTFVLFIVWRIILFTPLVSPEIFDSAALFTFPFGFFAGIPFLFVFDSRDLFVYGILIFLGSILNIIALTNFANFFVKKLNNVFE